MKTLTEWFPVVVVFAVFAWVAVSFAMYGAAAGL